MSRLFSNPNSVLYIPISDDFFMRLLDSKTPEQDIEKLITSNVLYPLDQLPMNKRLIQVNVIEATLESKMSEDGKTCKGYKIKKNVPRQVKLGPVLLPCITPQSVNGGIELQPLANNVTSYLQLLSDEILKKVSSLHF